ncbi:MAG: response regulator [Bacteroidales bacterium]|nr:response regulator [Bacteroidales bacterium]
MNAEILIVDDIPSNLNFISDILYNEGFRITVATNGKDAIETARIKKPDLILLDIAMPMIDGYEVCKILKSDSETNDIPIIFLTAKVDYEDIIKGFSAGAVDFVPNHLTLPN